MNSYILEWYYTNSPLSQFDISELLNINGGVLGNLRLSITNIGFYLIFSAFFILVFQLISINYNKLFNSKWSIALESLYATIINLVTGQIKGKKLGQSFFPFIFALFVFILINNIIGLIPYSFASTSHFALTFFLSFTIVLGATILGFQKHGLVFFSLLVPAGCPLALLPLLVLIEFISYLARCVSLGLRLGANIMSGHMLLSILSGFTYQMLSSKILPVFLVGLVPLSFIVAFSGLEMAIAVIQAQVFIILTSSYLNDAINLH